MLIDTRQVVPWTRYHYAELRGRGIAQLFDTLRYENAFLCRQADAGRLIHLMGDSDLRAIVEPITILICKYGERRPNWTINRLLSDQYLKELDIHELYEFGAEFTATRPTSRLKFCNEVEITGTIDTIITTMLNNRAMPASEGDAHRIEQAPYQPEQPITVRLRNFASAAGWVFE